MATHSSTLAWKVPLVGEPGRLQSMGLQRVGHDWVTWLSLFTFMHWRRKWQPTPVFMPRKSHGLRSLVGYSPWGHKESDMTEWLHFTSHAWLNALLTPSWNSLKCLTKGPCIFIIHWVPQITWQALGVDVGSKIQPLPFPKSWALL